VHTISSGKENDLLVNKVCLGSLLIVYMHIQT